MALRIDTIFCDDVRQEVSGKQILVGVYGSDIRANAPGPIDIWVWMRVSGLKTGAYDFHMQMLAPGEQKPLGGAKGQIEIVAESYPIPLAFGPYRIRAEKEGDLVVTVQIDEEHMEAGRISVGFGKPDEETEVPTED